MFAWLTAATLSVFLSGLIQVLAQDKRYFDDRKSVDQKKPSFTGYNKLYTSSPSEPNDPPKCTPCKCGVTNKQTRIVGGQETSVNEYPWMVILLYSGQFRCGGSLLNSKYILTASHCVFNSEVELFTLRIFDHDRSIDNETKHFDRKAECILTHSGYNENTINNDIALIRLQEEVSIQGLLRPVCLPPPGKSFAGERGKVTGWGRTQEGGAISATLQEVAQNIITNRECRRVYGSMVTSNMICAGFTEEEKETGSCQGDSGGPLLIMDSDDVHHVVGIVSWGVGCARPNFPGVYTRVNRYLSWIRSNTLDSCFCQPF